MVSRQRIRKGLILLSFFLFPATFFYFSPILIVMASSIGVVNGSFIVFVLLFASSMFLGRGFCGWLCPAGGCQETLFSVNEASVRRGYFLKWVIWIPWIIAIAIAAVLAGGYNKIEFFYMTTNGISVADLRSFAIYMVVLLVLIVLPGLMIGKRSFCHHVCWMAPFMILGRRVGRFLKVPSLRLQSKPDSCIHCHTCTENCPMSLPVEDMVKQRRMDHSECILCGTCVDGCKGGGNKVRLERPEDDRLGSIVSIVTAP